AIKHGENDGWASCSKGYLCFRGLGVPQVPAMAHEWFLKAAQQGLVSAPIEVGFLYFTGIGDPQDFTKAIEWLLKAANQGRSDAQLQVGLMY
ncbi:hypothetical protein BGZ89_002005, partial [Linnemannia elongata]